MPVVGSLLFCCIDLTLPERTKEVLERFARLDEWFLVGRGHRGTGDSFTSSSDPITSFVTISPLSYKQGLLSFCFLILLG